LQSSEISPDIGKKGLDIRARMRIRPRARISPISAIRSLASLCPAAQVGGILERATAAMKFLSDAKSDSPNEIERSEK
jgi:hypothetical protein